jgi:outer membrane protein assembly factor BamB
MTADGQSPTRTPLRVWPGVVIVALQAFARFVLPSIAPDMLYFSVMAGVAGGLLVAFWWLLFSRAPWVERIGAIVLIVAAMAATPPFLDASIRGGMMGLMFFVFFSPPFLSLAFVAWAVATRHLSDTVRRVTMVATIVLACGAWALFRTGGITGDAHSDLRWRWSKTPEERLLAQQDDRLDDKPDDSSTAAPATPPPPEASAPAPTNMPAAPTAAEKSGPVASPLVREKSKADWPGFRGADRDSVVAHERIVTDWTASPPRELWRRPIGPGWSSFAVRGNRVYTQEQRGADEIVSCYNLTTGKPIWRHRDPARFYESNGGPGPRGTPTISGNRVYTFGATGIVNALDAGNGGVAWSHNAVADTGAKVPGWGFASSPLVVDDIVVVATAGTLVAYDLENGDRRWVGPKGGSGYSSPQLVTIDGAQQIVLLNGRGAVSVAPADGKQLWEHRLPGYARIVQPAVTSSGDLLVHDGEGNSMRRIGITHGSSGWTTQERWSSIGLKPYFNDFVVHYGHAYGFDGSILACIDLEDGTRKWKGGRYGHGQLLLLAEQDVLLVLSEEGELALVQATPDKFTELARVPAIEGKTWNHPVLVRDILLVRNGQEMAAFRLSLEGRGE